MVYSTLASLGRHTGCMRMPAKDTTHYIYILSDLRLCDYSGEPQFTAPE